MVDTDHWPPRSLQDPLSFSMLSSPCIDVRKQRLDVWLLLMTSLSANLDFSALQHIPKLQTPDHDTNGSGGSTMVVVSLILEIQGDSIKFDGAGYSIFTSKEVLAGIASDCLVADGFCLNAAKIFGHSQQLSRTNQRITFAK